MKAFIRYFCVVLALFSLFASDFVFAWSNSELSFYRAEENQSADFSKVEGKLTIAINKTSFPYHSINSQGQAVGLMIDLWRLWAKKQQVEIAFVPLSWTETLKQVGSGEVDIHAGLSIIEQRREFLAYSQAIFPLYTHVYVHRDLTHINSVNDLRPYAVGVVKGSAHINMLANAYPELKQRLFNSRHELYQAAMNNEVLVFTGLEKLASDYEFYQQLQQMFPAHKRLRYQQGEYGVAVAKDRVDLLAFIEQGFAKITLAERVAIERKWLGLEKQKNSLLVAIAPNYSPYMALTPSGKPQGLLVDVWRYWAQQAGVNIEFVAREITEDISLVKEKKVDVLLAYPHTGNGIDDVLFAQDIYQSNAQVYVAKHVLGIESLSSFTQQSKEHLIGIWQDSPFKAQLLEQYPNLNYRVYASSDEMLKAAERNEISAMISLVDLMDAKLVQANLQSSFYRLDKPVFTVSLSPLVHQANKELLNLINQTFTELDIEQLVKLEERWLTSTDRYYKKLAQKITLTAEEQAFLQAKSSIRVGMVNDLSPVEFINDDGEFAGINRDILDLIAQRTGLNFTYRGYDTWQQLFQALLNEEIDLLGSITPTDKRKEQMRFSESYWRMPWVIMHPQHVGKQSKLTDFYGKRVAIVRGYYLISQLRKQHPLISFILVDNRKQGLKALQQGKVDGFITTIAAATELLKQESLITMMVSVMETVNLDDSRFGINKDLPLLVNIIDKGLMSISEKEKQAIYDNWFSVEINTGLDKNVVLQVGAQIGIIILLVLIVIVMWNRRLQSEINHREQLEQIMKHMATHDELTGLANRVLLKDRLSTAIEFHQRQGLQMAVLFIDLDGFKTINDSYGHDVGDELLKIVAQRLAGCVRKSDTVVRFGGDEFVLLLTGLHSDNEAAYVAEKVLHLMQTPFELSKTKATIGCSIGIAMYPGDGETDNDLLKVADTLMYQVKAAGKNHFVFNEAS